MYRRWSQDRRADRSEWSQGGMFSKQMFKEANSPQTKNNKKEMLVTKESNLASFRYFVRNAKGDIKGKH